MHWFDIGVGILVVVGSVWSFFRGLTREVLSILGMTAAIVFSLWGYPYVARQIEPLVALPWLRQAIGFGLIFLCTTIVYVLLARGLHRLVKAAGLSWPDRVLGGLFGAIKVIVVIAAFLIVTTQFFPLFAAKLATETTLAPPLFRTANILSTLLPPHTTEAFHRFYHRMQPQLPVWIPMPRTPPPPVTTQAPGHEQEGISESDAQALEKILQERLKTR